MEEDELPDLKKESDLPIIPNYLANPPFPYVYNTMSNSIPDPSMNGSISHLEPRDTDSASLPDVETYVHAPLHHGNAAPEVADTAGTPSLPRRCTVPPHTKPVLQRGPMYQGSVSWSRTAPSPVGSNQSVPQQENGSCMGPVPAFQPVFFTGAFPLNMQGNSKNLFLLCLRNYVTLDNENRQLQVIRIHSISRDFQVPTLRHSGSI